MKGHPYIELTVTFAPGEERDLWRDAAVFYLSEAGFDVFEDDEEGRLHAYAPKEAFSETAAREALEPLGEGKADLAFREIEDRDWNEEWEKNYHRPIEVIPGRLVVRASFHEARPDVPFDLVIDPKMAFGTGNHDTTSGMLRLIDTLGIEGKTVIDMGCGSGILGIFAMKKGAAACTSIDIDDRSTENALLNARVNGVTLRVVEGDARALQGLPEADFFFANITRNIILQDLDHYLAALRPGGSILLSGFLAEDLPIITGALAESGLEVTEILHSPGDWIALKAHRLQ